MRLHKVVIDKLLGIDDRRPVKFYKYVMLDDFSAILKF